jgi:UDP-N-acetylglucosamine diphosphorylase / glucose-1-phosphate thymidylyltransferase / UDP-N-acetylgalactosamine diphosphorylase / glucosamine-1-phosphate N-acetyltransferase / galactosamine-1-phosphate N-acetyltransferase
MPNIILFDDPQIRRQLLPFTYTRPVAAIRCGIHTISEKWSNWLSEPCSYLTETYLSTLFPVIHGADNLYINGALCPDYQLIEVLLALPPEHILLSKNNELLAARTGSVEGSLASKLHALPEMVYDGSFLMIRQVWDIFLNNGGQIRADFDKLINTRTTEPLTDAHTRCYEQQHIFIEPGANIKAAILNAEQGPIYIGRNAMIQEGASIQGPFAIEEGSVIAQNAKIRMNTTVGPFSKVGGEVSGSVLFGYSNKGHDGYLGNSVVGEWCNLGANTNNSNLKNDHSVVKLHSYVSNSLESTGLTFCGLFMGDYSKAGISTMFNTGTVVGVNVNVFGAGFQPKHIPSFSWGGNADGFIPYRLDKALDVARDTVSRRGLHFEDTEENMLKEVFQQTQPQRETTAQKK